MRNSLHSNAPSSKRNWSESSDISSPSTTRQPRYSYSSVITPSAVASSSTSATPPIQASSAAFFHTPAIASQAMQLQPNLSPTLERQRSQALISHNNFSKMPISSLPHIESSDTVLDACMFEPFYHNPAKDHISNDPIYHPAYIKAVEHVKMMIAILRSLISPDKLRDPVWFEIAQDLEKDLHPYRSADVRVAVAGMLGEGKSMLVGALLGNAGVTKSSESGQSCTKIPTEYYYLKKTENVNYAADFILFGWKKNESRVIRSFEFMANYLSSEDSQSPEDCEDEKFEKSRALLGALFPDSKKFNYKKTPETENQDKAELKEYLSQEDTLKNLLEDTKWFYDEASSQLSKEHFATKEQLWGRLCLFTRNVYSAGSSPNLWPFVKLIRIGGDFPALQHGVRIADLPGLNDIDYINQEATHTYLSQSSATIVVQRISRAIDGIDGRRAFVEIMKSSPNAHSMAMVLTHSEDVEPRSLEAHGLQDETFRKAERREFEELDCYISEIDCERSWCRDPQMMARNSLKLRLIQRR
ncbi:uncharacterized protein K460DRAFT_140245 [Cucurbitaria berberidis CBS 394.84]|uniref:Dynamin N-terminal domain-containing protein n=1 Tax=Cucurbitaria berberidis CBS 394.84 TaxID=1168544 RepID=A0A9P4GCN6_9PLEO|nr:uncharacterized protein K460DRAFT_140245 [Cucurbitaria berberidis CBS 394.84]KAF1843150.1 hypothetical protein K460DRAFT_140245 [Cucurbitaria berberidis CBS 394.84]